MWWYQGLWFFSLTGRDTVELQILLREFNMKLQRKAKMAWETEMEDEAQPINMYMCIKEKRRECSSLGVLCVRCIWQCTQKRRTSNLAKTANHRNLTSKDFSCFKNQQVISLFSISFMLPLTSLCWISFVFLLSNGRYLHDFCLVLLYKNTGILKTNGSVGGTQIPCSSLQYYFILI